MARHAFKYSCQAAMATVSISLSVCSKRDINAATNKCIDDPQTEAICPLPTKPCDISARSNTLLAQRCFYQRCNASIG
uniref:Uncharacterized protein n=1 Tax=Anopheles albimanus TaxID=7167 RepID=A0A182FXL7_ANOAL